MDVIAGYVRNMAPYMICAAPVVFLLRLAGIKRLKRKGLSTSFWHEAGVWCFLLFTAGLASITIVPRTPEGGLTGFIGLEGLKRINVILFRVVTDSMKEAARGNVMYPLINIAGNIVMFMPAGFFTALLWKGESMKKAALAGFLFSLTVELCQLPQARGTDIDDLWLNTLGGVCGYGVFLLIKRWRPEWIVHFRVREAEAERKESGQKKMEMEMEMGKRNRGKCSRKNRG